ncbi:MAG: hypothetical protein AVDCRST_MAG19-2953, partial [uncultured Thermomicrobiales bacterium]
GRRPPHRSGAGLPSARPPLGPHGPDRRGHRRPGQRLREPRGGRCVGRRLPPACPGRDGRPRRRRRANRRLGARPALVADV